MRSFASHVDMVLAIPVTTLHSLGYLVNGYGKMGCMLK